MIDRVSVFVSAPDPVSQAGIVAQLRGQPGLKIIESLGATPIDVGIVSIDSVTDDAIQRVRAIQRNGCRTAVVMIESTQEQGLLRLVEEGVSGVIRRGDASPERLAQAIMSAHDGGGSLPNDMLGGLLRQIKVVHDRVLAPQGMQFSGLSDREVDVLRLVADGLDTREIADELSYSQRTIKGVIHDVVGRFGLRNRSHAVAFALRQGLI